MLQTSRLFPETVSVSFTFPTEAVPYLRLSLDSAGVLRAGQRQDVTWAPAYFVMQPVLLNWGNRAVSVR